MHKHACKCMLTKHTFIMCINLHDCASASHISLVFVFPKLIDFNGVDVFGGGKAVLTSTNATNLTDNTGMILNITVLFLWLWIKLKRVTCSILWCVHLGLQATSLNCSHSFCEYCIQEWMKRKMECPICRRRITSQMYSRVIDSYIDKVVDALSDDMKKRREEVITARRGEVFMLLSWWQNVAVQFWSVFGDKLPYPVVHWKSGYW